jgi:DnaJ-domain-containing protein 1
MGADLQQLLFTILEQRPEGVTEHALLRLLQAERGDDFPDGLFRDPLALFRAHFLLFHALYRLREQLLADAAGSLQIDPRAIRLTPCPAPAARSLADHDPMRDYYLDLANLEDTGAEDVERLLGAFWARYFAGSRRSEALAALGLAPSADLDTAQRRYRELAMQHHPDRGGDPEQFRRIREAIAILRRC